MARRLWSVEPPTDHNDTRQDSGRDGEFRAKQHHHRLGGGTPCQSRVGASPRSILKLLQETLSDFRGCRRLGPGQNQLAAADCQGKIILSVRTETNRLVEREMTSVIVVNSCL
ncbi:hypothetical protein RRG08_001631 [Elysia crispata]|uniref:Uncharacterized protein n=1 Tax=Elysia crispata TaxID=231223 RepID=A0AAE1DZY9_9GAST|nr:hypothetical protein RRG08_001631 [Elysia crispata]